MPATRQVVTGSAADDRGQGRSWRWLRPPAGADRPGREDRRCGGLYVPLLTPLTADGSLDPGAVAPHVERLLAGGADGIVALGTTGEFADLTADERAEVVASVVAAVAGRVPVLVGVGAVGTTGACAHARAAAGAGADGVLALPPLYWKLGEGGIVRHFAAVAASTALPVLLYDFPSLSGSPLSPVLVERVAREVPGVAGIKLSGPELRTVHGVLARVKAFQPDFSVMVGAAELAFPALAAGADGMIAAIANVDPQPLAGLLAAVAAGRFDEAARLHARVLDLLAIPAQSAPPVLALKAGARVWGSPLETVVRTPPDDPDAAVVRATQRATALR